MAHPVFSSRSWLWCSRMLECREVGCPTGRTAVQHELVPYLALKFYLLKLDVLKAFWKKRNNPFRSDRHYVSSYCQFLTVITIDFTGVGINWMHRLAGDQVDVREVNCALPVYYCLILHTPVRLPFFSFPFPKQYLLLFRNPNLCRLLIQI